MGSKLKRKFFSFDNLNVVDLPFESCGSAKPILINDFKAGKFKENVETLFTDKTSNLNATSEEAQCFQSFCQSFTCQSFVRTTQLPNQLHLVVGEEGSLSENGTAEGPFLTLLKDKADWLVIYRLKFIDATLPYFSAKISFMTATRR